MASEFFGNLNQLLADQDDDVIDWSELKEFRVFETGWYDATVDMSEAKKDRTQNGSRVLNFHVKVKDPEDGHEQRVRARVFLSGPGTFLTNELLRACGVTDPKTVLRTADLIRATHGKQIAVYLKKEVSQNGNEYNSVAHFRPLSNTNASTLNVL